MVTLKNNDEDNDLTMHNSIMILRAAEYRSDVNTIEAKNSQPENAKAVLTCRKNSHPFEERTLVLDQPVKIGRSVARARPSPSNGIFDCKVLSRNHALIYYDDGKFYIQDTKSSNGTFVNNQRLSKGAEDSPPREIYSGDIVQFGVDVCENQKKVTHGCIVATMKLFYPNGKEAKNSQSTSVNNSMSSIPQEDICMLQLLLYEAQQREERLHDKLEELQVIIKKLEVDCQETLTNHFEETRLLSKIENLEKQTKVLTKIRPPGTAEKTEIEIQQLLLNVENVQSASHEIQQKLHKKVLDREQRLAEAERVASNLELEVAYLREQAGKSEENVQELAAKCTTYSQTIDELKSKLAAQWEMNQELELQMELKREEYQRREVLFQNRLDKFFAVEKMVSGNIIIDQNEEEIYKDKKEIIFNLEKSILEQDERDRINEDDFTENLSGKMESLKKTLQLCLQGISKAISELSTAYRDYELTRRELNTYFSKKKTLLFEIAAAKIPVNKHLKTENCETEFQNDEIENSEWNAEKLSRLEVDLKDMDDFFGEAVIKHNDLEDIYHKRKSELYAAINVYESLEFELSALRSSLKNHPACLESSAEKIFLKMENLETELNNKEKSPGSFKESLSENKESQTDILETASAETNTDFIESRRSSIDSKISCSETVTYESDPTLYDTLQSLDALDAVIDEHLSLDDDDDTNLVSSLDDNDDSTALHPSESDEETKSIKISQEKLEDVEEKLEEKLSHVKLDNLSPSSLSVYERMQRIQTLSDNLSSQSNVSSEQVKEMKLLMVSIGEDIVHLLLREQQINSEKRTLQDKLAQSRSQADIAALGLANQFLALMVGVFLYYVGGRILQYLGLLDR